MYMLKGPNLSVHRLNEESDSKGIYYLLNSITEKIQNLETDMDNQTQVTLRNSKKRGHKYPYIINMTKFKY